MSNEENYSHYRKVLDVSEIDELVVDPYFFFRLYNITDPAIQHAVKKLMAPGQRGAKDWIQDVAEARDSLDRAAQLEMLFLKLQK